MASERRLAEIRERLAAATPGPWELYATERNVIAITKGRMRSGYRREIVHWSGFDCSNIDDPGQVRANAALIAHAPSDLAYLLDEIARLTRELDAARAENRRLREALERVVDGGCERFAGTDCWQMGMDPNAKDYADRVCDPCFARRALATDTEVGNGE